MAKTYKYSKGDRVLIQEGERKFKGTIVAVGKKKPHDDRVYDVVREDGQTGGGIRVRGLKPKYGEGPFTAWRLYTDYMENGHQKIVRKLPPLKRA